MSADVIDLAIIGGGPAGMSAALVAGRARLRTVVVNEEQPRNAVTTASHGFLTRDGAHPAELLSIAKQQLRKYDTVRYVQGRAQGVEAVAGGVRLHANGETVTARRVIIATGYRDDLASLKLPGIVDVYGKSVYPCPFCDGFEHRDERIAVFGAAGAEHLVPVVRVWSSDVILFTNGEALDEAVASSMRDKGVEVVLEPVVRLHSTDGNLTAVEVHGGRTVVRDSGFVASDTSVPATKFPDELGVGTTVNDWGMEVCETHDAGKTNVANVYVVGDASHGFSGLIDAAAEGSRCAADIVIELAMERWAASGSSTG